VNLLHATACEWRFSGKREPERFAERIDVGAHVERSVFKLFRTGECRRTDKSVMGQRLWIDLSVNCLSQAEVDYFHQQLFMLLMGASTQRGGYRSVRDIVVTALCRRAGRNPVCYRRFAIGRDEHQICGF
jgi:hypothetical protein